MEVSEIRAVVRSLDGEFALVEVEQGGCGRCHEKGGCGGQQLTQAFCSAPKRFRVGNPGGVVIGEQVTLRIPAAAVRYGANLVYGLPLVGILAGAAVGMLLHGDPGAMLGGGVGLLAAWLIIRFKTRQGLENSLFEPKIVNSGSIPR